MYNKLIQTYKELLEDALPNKRVLLDSGDYAGLLILLKDEDIKPVQDLFTEYHAIKANWGKIIYLDDSKRTRMFLSNSYPDRNMRFSTYVNEFPTYGAVTPEWRESVDKFINHIDSL